MSSSSTTKQQDDDNDTARFVLYQGWLITNEVRRECEANGLTAQYWASERLKHIEQEAQTKEFEKERKQKNKK